MFPVLFLLPIILLFYYFAVRPMSYWKRRGVKQTNPTWFFGDTANNLFRTRRVVELKKELYEKFPSDRYLGYYEFSTPTLLIKDPKLLKHVVIKHFESFMDHRILVPVQADPLWGRNLLALQGKQWKEMRSILSPAFTAIKMKIMFDLMNDCAEKFVTFFQKKDGNVIDVKIKDASTRFTNDVIATSAFGVAVDSMEAPKNEFYLMGQHITAFTFWKSMKVIVTNLYQDFYRIINFHLFDEPSRSFFANLIKDTLRVRQEKGIIRPDMIHLMVEARKEVNRNRNDKRNGKLEASNGNGSSDDTVTDVDIIANSLIFLFAGFESVSTLISFMAYELALNPDIQNRLRKEILEGVEECNGKLTYEALSKMKYLDMVTSETLRKWPSFANTDRICTKQFTIEPELPHENPAVIEKGTLLEIPIFAMHRDPKYFPNPERFDPERFSDENKDKIEPCSYIPFGAGPRICIGNRFALMEARIFFVHILRAFEIVPTSDTPIPLQLNKGAFNVQPEGHLSLGFKRYSE